VSPELLPDWFYFKIPDAPILVGGDIQAAPDLPKPFDCFIANGSRSLPSMQDDDVNVFVGFLQPPESIRAG
jgi:hypothetical protein